uniref:CCHC-type domain-containing protein n=1 Tax=Erpetoichthys calabaricus TaxID=27687 RepID=A0A8C4TGD6_ERPCA
MLMNRKEFTDMVLFEQLQVNPEDIFCSQLNSLFKFVDVTFATGEIFRSIWVKIRAQQDTYPLAYFELQCLWRKETKVVTVHVFNPFVEEEDIVTFLSYYCESVSSLRWIRDCYGIWTGKRQFKVTLKEDRNSADGLRHPPAYFSLGPNKGYLFYNGQLKHCNRCGQEGHLATFCSLVRCRNCDNLGHTAKTCPNDKRCDLCKEHGHVFQTCPHRYRPVHLDNLPLDNIEAEDPPSSLPPPVPKPPIKVLSSKLQPLWFSDHTMLTCTILLDLPSFGKGFWKFNVSLLEDANFCTQLKDLLLYWTEARLPDTPIFLW